MQEIVWMGTNRRLVLSEAKPNIQRRMLGFASLSPTYGSRRERR
jgi:hypothetical protein